MRGGRCGHVYISRKHRRRVRSRPRTGDRSRSASAHSRIFTRHLSIPKDLDEEFYAAVARDYENDSLPALNELRLRGRDVFGILHGLRRGGA